MEIVYKIVNIHPDISLSAAQSILSFLHKTGRVNVPATHSKFGVSIKSKVLKIAKENVDFDRVQLAEKIMEVYPELDKRSICKTIHWLHKTNEINVPPTK